MVKEGRNIEEMKFARFVDDGRWCYNRGEMILGVCNCKIAEIMVGIRGTVPENLRHPKLVAKQRTSFVSSNTGPQNSDALGKYFETDPRNSGLDNPRDSLLLL